MKVASKKDSVTVDWKWNPMSTVSLKAQKETATHILLNKSNADVLVEPQYIVTRRGIFRRRSVTVTGYPATYTDFRPMTEADAEKIATINGDYNTVMVNPVISTTTGKVVKPAQKPKGQPFSRVNKKTDTSLSTYSEVQQSILSIMLRTAITLEQCAVHMGTVGAGMAN